MSDRCPGSWTEVTVRDETVRVRCGSCGHRVACQQYVHRRGYISHMMIEHDDHGHAARETS